MKFLISLSVLSIVGVTWAQPVHGPLVTYTGNSYHGPPAPLAHDGRVVDTPEVAHAKAAHFHAYHEELSKTKGHLLGSHDDGGHLEYSHDLHSAGPIHHETHHYDAPHGYHGPPAPLAHDGRVVDTPEVAHAKAKHFHAYAEELSKVSHHQPHHDGGHNYHYL